MKNCIPKDECKIALIDFKNYKTSGIDGLLKEFYLQFWDYLGKDIT